jgi:hypothetical protein
MRRELLALSFSGLLLVACGGAAASTADTQPGTAATPGATPTDPPVAATNAVGSGSGTPDTVAAVQAPEALQFAAPMVGGGEIDFTQYAGQTIALWFWAPT